MRIFYFICYGLLRMVKSVFWALWGGIKNTFTDWRRVLVFVGGTALAGLGRFLYTKAGASHGAVLDFLALYAVVVFPVACLLINGGLLRDIALFFPRRKYRRLFNQIKFYSKDDFVPSYSGKTKTENMDILRFYSTIPTEKWQRSQGLLEAAFNRNFHEIRQASYNNRITEICILKTKLPKAIEWQDKYMAAGDVLAIGVGYYGTVGMDLNRQPHAFVAGETGSGKSVILQNMMHQAIEKGHFVSLIDFKRGVSFAGFRDRVDIVMELPAADRLLAEAVQEVKERLNYFAAIGVQDIWEHNKAAAEPFPRWLIFIDELAELMDSRGADKDEKALITSTGKNLRTLARLARAAGVHLILGIQRPDAEIISGQIKSNVPFRICGRFADPQPSIIVLGNDKAAHLPNIPGRFIINDEEVQAFYYRMPPARQKCPPKDPLVLAKTKPPTEDETPANTPWIACERVEEEKKPGLDLDFE